MTEPSDTSGLSPVIARRRLSVALRELREAADMTATQVARQLGVSTSTVTRRERNEWDDPDPRAIKPHLDVLSVDDEKTRTELLNLAKAGRVQAWWDRFRDNLTSTYSRYIGLEAGASKLWLFEPNLIPHLLQTEEYTRAALPLRYRHFIQPGTEYLEQHIDILRRRQRAITREASLSVWALLDETALHRAPRTLGAEQMRSQLDHLHTLAGMPNIIVQVIPWSEGVHACANPFIVLRFQDPADSEVGLMETVQGAELVDQPEEVERLESAWASLLAIALPRVESRDLIANPGTLGAR